MARNNETFGQVSTPSAGGSGAATTVFGGTIDPVAQQRMNQRRLAAQLRDPGEPGLLGQEPHDPNQIIIGDDWPGEPLDTPQPQTLEMARVSALRQAAFRTGAELSLLSGLETVKARTFGNPDLDDQEAASRFRQNAALLARDAVDGMARTFGVPVDGLEMPTRAVLEDIVEGVASEGARARARGLEEKALDIMEAGADDLLAQIRRAPDLAEGYAHQMTALVDRYEGGIDADALAAFRANMATEMTQARIEGLIGAGRTQDARTVLADAALPDGQKAPLERTVTEAERDAVQRSEGARARLALVLEQRLRSGEDFGGELEAAAQGALSPVDARRLRQLEVEREARRAHHEALIAQVERALAGEERLDTATVEGNRALELYLKEVLLPALAEDDPAFRDAAVAWLAGRFGHVPQSVQRDLLAQIQPGQPAAVRMTAVDAIAAIVEADGALIEAFPRDVQDFVNNALQARHDTVEDRLAWADGNVQLAEGEEGVFAQPGRDLTRGYYQSRMALDMLSVASEAREIVALRKLVADLRARSTETGSPHFQSGRVAEQAITYRPINGAVEQLDEQIVRAEADLEAALQSFMDHTAEAQRYPAPEVLQAINEAESLGEAWKAFTDAPLTAISSATLESVPIMVPALVAGALNPKLGVIVMGMSSYGMTFGNLLADFAVRQGVEVADLDAMKAFYQNPENLQSALDFAADGALPVALMDALGARIASKTFVPVGPGSSTLTRAIGETANLALQDVVQGSLGATGEALSNLLTTGDIAWGSVFIEAIAETGIAPVEVLAFSRERLTEHFGKPVEAITIEEVMEAADDPELAFALQVVDVLEREANTPDTRQVEAAELSSLGVRPKPLLDPGDAVEIVVAESRYSELTPKEARAVAKEDAKTTVTGTYINLDTGWEIALGTGGIAKSLSGDGSAVRAELVHYLPELLRSAVRVESHPDTTVKGRDSFRAIHRLYASFMLDGRTNRVKLTVREDRIRGNLHYAVEFIEISEHVSLGDGQDSQSSMQMRTINLGDLLSGVKYENHESIFQIPE